MKVKELVERLGLKVLGGADGLDREVGGCYVSDLLSDVVAGAPMGDVWITLHTHKTIVAVASLKGLSCIIVDGGHAPDADAIEQSDKEGIPLLATPLSTFETAGRIYVLLR